MTQKRKIGLLIIVFVALICIYMWVRAWNQSEQAQANTMIRITDTEGDKIKKIALNIENGELNFEKENGVWYDALDHDTPINQSIMNEIADTVGSNLDRLGELEELGGKRHKFPAKGGTHSGRWCSGNLKAAVQDSVTANLEETKRDKKILIVSGERRGESAGRSKYNEMEIHRTNAEAKAHRIVHQWRCCIDYSEKDVWELLKRHHINPHPCYRIGWNRCSCMMCIFSTPRLFAGVKELFPDDYAALQHDEEVLGFTLDNKKNLDEFIGDTQSCVCWKDKAAIHSILTGEFNTDDIYTNDWNYPVGAFHGADGGSC